MIDTEKREYRIPMHNLGYLNDKVAKLNKKAAKLECEPIVINQIDTEQAERFNENDEKYFIEIAVITIDGEAPKLKGWSFLAVLETFEDIGENLIKTVPNIELTEDERNHYRFSGSMCEYCGINRYRTATYLVRNDDGDTKQVGSSCLKDFLGHVSPQQYANYAEWLADLAEFADSLEDENYGGVGGHWGYSLFPIENYLVFVAMAMRIDGWMSRGKARDFGATATADIAWDMMTVRKFWEHKGNIQRYVRQDEDIVLAAKSLEWAREWLPENSKDNDYLWNLMVATKREVVDRRTIGIAASVISAYLRQMEKEITYQKRNEAAKNSNYVGTLKARLTFNLTVTGIQFIDGEYGTTILYSFLDENGNILKWFSSRSLGLEQGETYRIMATVKAHQEYQGIKQTLVNRGKLV